MITKSESQLTYMLKTLSIVHIAERKPNNMADVQIINHKTMQPFTPDSFHKLTKVFWNTHKDLVVDKYNKKGEWIASVPKPLTIEKFCEYAEISIEVFKYLETQPEYKDACEMLKTNIYARTMEGGLLGDFNAALTQKMMEQHSPKVYSPVQNGGANGGVNISVSIMPVANIEQIKQFETKHLIEDKEDKFDFNDISATEVKDNE